MLYCFEYSQRLLFGDIYDQQLQLRHHVFVEGLGWQDKDWNIAELPGREEDSFDCDDTCYTIWVDDAGKVQAASRLISTASRYMVRELWAGFVDGALPDTPKIAELSRVCVNPDASRQVQSVAFNSMNIGGMAYNHSRGVEKVLVFSTLPVLANGLAGRGVQWFPAGPELMLDGEPHLAVYSEPFTAKTIQRERLRCQLADFAVVEPFAIDKVA